MWKTQGEKGLGGAMSDAQKYLTRTIICRLKDIIFIFSP